VARRADPETHIVALVHGKSPPSIAPLGDAERSFDVIRSIPDRFASLLPIGRRHEA
jgi:hypothetical protein